MIAPNGDLPSPSTARGRRACRRTLPPHRRDRTQARTPPARRREREAGKHPRATAGSGATSAGPRSRACSSSYLPVAVRILSLDLDRLWSLHDQPKPLQRGGRQPELLHQREAGGMFRARRGELDVGAHESSARCAGPTSRRHRERPQSRPQLELGLRGFHERPRRDVQVATHSRKNSPLLGRVASAKRLGRLTWLRESSCHSSPIQAIFPTSPSMQGEAGGTSAGDWPQLSRRFSPRPPASLLFDRSAQSDFSPSHTVGRFSLGVQIPRGVAGSGTANFFAGTPPPTSRSPESARECRCSSSRASWGRASSRLTRHTATCCPTPSSGRERRLIRSSQLPPIERSKPVCTRSEPSASP
jgi:hypothetical protein